MGRLMVLWAVGVGSVIGGDFFGWSYLLSSGIGSSLISLFLTMCMYYFLAKCVSSLNALVAKPGGADVFVAEGLGTHAGLVTAALETAKILLCTCAINNGAVSYLQATVDLGDGIGIYMSYIGLFALFCYLNLWGAKYSGGFQIMVTVFSLSVLVFYWSSVCSTIDFNKFAIGSSSGWFVDGISGFLMSQPFASWLFLGFEELPLVAKSMADEEDLEVPTMVQLAALNDNVGPGSVISSSYNESFVLPKSEAASVSAIIDNRSNTCNQLSASSQQNSETTAMLLSFVTIAVAGTLTTLLGASSNPGAHILSTAASPLVDGVKGVYGNGSWVVKMLNFLVIVALVTPFNAFLLFSAHHLSLLSLNNMLPAWFHQDKLLPVSWTALPRRCIRSKSSETLLHSDASNNTAGNSMGQPKVEHSVENVPLMKKHPETPKNAIIFVGICGSLVLAVLTIILGSGMI
jgi:amino acid transporter